MEDPAAMQSLPEQIKKVWRLTSVLATGIILVIGEVIIWTTHFLVSFASTLTTALGIIYFFLLILIGIFDLILVAYRYQFHRYQVTETDLAIQKGYFFRKLTFVPMNRIQHIEMEQGPFLRQQQLISLVIHTAATAHKIEGIAEVDAQALRKQILLLVKAAKADV